MSHNTGIAIGGPRAGLYHSSSDDKVILDGVEYRYRVLVRFRDNQHIGAWCLPSMSNIVALERVFDAYAAYWSDVRAHG